MPQRDNADLKKVVQAEYQMLLQDSDWLGQEAQKQEHAHAFQVFWKGVICSGRSPSASPEDDYDPIIRLIDVRARGYTGGRWGAVAMTYIYQPTWYRLFNDLRTQKGLRTALTNAFQAADDGARIKALDRLYKLNEKNKNGLTGQQGNAVNALLALYNPVDFLSIVSLAHRYALMEQLGLGDLNGLEQASWGQQVIRSNRCIIDGFKRRFGLDLPPRGISFLVYQEGIKAYWHPKSDPQLLQGHDDESAPTSPAQIDETAFALEKHLENFLVANWERTPLGRKYDLIIEDGNILSQQYRTDVGIIDILAQDKKGNYVVFELKKGKTSDATVGQILRYIGWVQTHRAKGKSVKGIIIALEDDPQLQYALYPLGKMIEFYRYKIDFTLVR